MNHGGSTRHGLGIPANLRIFTLTIAPVIIEAMNPKNAIEVLQNQIEKLDAKDFELNAWKNFTILLLERIFGKNTQKTEAISRIKYDQGSWVLRDETGYANSMEACKKLGREILTEAILELETFGAPENASDSISFGIIRNALKDELTGSQMREIMSTLSEKGAIKDRKKVLLTKLESYGSAAALAIVANILSNEDVSARLTED